MQIRTSSWSVFPCLRRRLTSPPLSISSAPSLALHHKSRSFLLPPHPTLRPLLRASTSRHLRLFSAKSEIECHNSHEVMSNSLFQPQPTAEINKLVETLKVAEAKKKS